ncbi:MAG: histidinol-phosphate transaminase [Puniceicoccales bacterium]|jgi:histidinol-phosphate aminotransferase|nr:histidinol-phosphate transaminase [Puniceicoccales bacterium]
MSTHSLTTGAAGTSNSAVPPLASLANPTVLTQPAYEPGKPVEVVAREFGLDPAAVDKLASNENALGPSPLALAAARDALAGVNFYPDGGANLLREKLAAHWSLSPAQFLVGNGSNEVMILLAQAFLRAGDEVVFGAEAFIVYKLAALLFGAKPVAVPMPAHTHDLAALRAAVTPRTKLVFLACPNNPTGTVNTAGDIAEFARSLPAHVILVLDEAYAEYLPDGAALDIRPLVADGVRIVGARTFSKIYGLAGLRCGYLYGDAEIVGLAARARQPFNVNLVAQTAATAALDDVEFLARARAENAAGLRQIEAGLAALGLHYTPSHANFVLFNVPRKAAGSAATGSATAGEKIPDAARVFDVLQRRGVIVRPLAGYGMPDSLRVTVGTAAQNERFLRELAAAL